MDNKAFTSESDVEQHGQGPGPGIETPPSDEKKKALDDLSSSAVPKSDGTVRMERQIGLIGGIALILGTMIGSGIFVSPTGLLKNTGSAHLSLVVWTACGVLATLAALSYCELGTVVPRSGGEHAYYMATFPPLNRFFGELPGFLYAWATVLLLKPSSLSIVSLATGKYALYPVLKMSRFCAEFEDEPEYKLAVKLLAVVVATLIAAINIISAKLATRAGIVFLGAKLATMAIMIGIGVYNIAKGEYGALDGGWESTNSSIGDIANSFYSGLWAYDGWNNLNLATEELINPYRNLPLAILIGIPLSTVLYVAINVAYLTSVTTTQEMIDSDVVAVHVGDQYLGPVKLLIPIMVAIAAIGTGNGSMFTAGRITYAVGRDGHMIDVMSYVHATRLTPIIALCLNAGLAYIMIFASEIEKLIDLFGFASWIIYGLAISCVIILRFTQPDAPRPFKVPIIIPIIAVILSAALVVLPIAYDPKIEYLAVLGFFALGILVYIPFVYKKYRLPYMDEFTRGIQYITLAAPSPYKED